jgi:FdrA protein
MQLMEHLMKNKNKVADLISKPLNIVNIGLEGFAQELKQQSIAVTHVEWSPPAGGNPKIAALLLKLGT